MRNVRLKSGMYGAVLQPHVSILLILNLVVYLISMNISTSTIQQRRRKPTQNVIEEEDASQLKLGPEFDIKQITHEGLETPLITLNLSEARLLINATLKQRRKQANGGTNAYEEELENNNDEEEEDFSNSNEVLRKTQEYLSIFARFRSEQTVSAVEHLLKSSDNADLHPFEIAQLGSLTCDEAEEAKTLIASLANKKTDEELQILLDHVGIATYIFLSPTNKLRRFG